MLKEGVFVSHKVQRNEPCPCGSGKKYKKCCMEQVRQQEVARADRREGIQKALTWISSHYRSQIDQWVEEEWLGHINAAERQGIAQADPKIRGIHDVNLLEQLVAEGRFSGLEGESRPLQLILSAADLQLDAGQRAYIEQLQNRPLRLYRVTECQASENFTVEDCISAEPYRVEDRWASRMFDPGDVVGLRMMQTEGGWETSGAIYHIPEPYVAELQPQLEAAGDKYSAILTNYWLQLVARHV